MRRGEPTVGPSTDGIARAILRGGEAAVDTGVGAVLVAGLLPGERARLADVGRRGGALRGRVAERLADSTERVVAPCSVQATCGGCPLMIWRVDAQRAWKRALVAHAVGLPAPDVVLVAGAELGYRRRARLVWSARRGQTTTIGYRAPRSHAVVEPTDCVVLSAPLSLALARLRALCAPSLAGEGELRLTASGADRVVVAIDARASQAPGAYAACAALAADPGIAGVSLQVGEAAAATWGDVTERTLGADGAELVAPPGAFSQAHRGVNDALVAHVVRLAQTRDARVLELFAGHGNLTVALAPGAAEVVAVERDARAVAAGAANVRSRGLSHVRFVAGDAAALAAGPRVDVVVLDPPREGAKAVLAAVAGRRPARIVYVSCDTATLARDVGALRALGYRPDAAVALDMFPQTAHVEAVVRLVAAHE